MLLLVIFIVGFLYKCTTVKAFTSIYSSHPLSRPTGNKNSYNFFMFLLENGT
jgi:hypothetical protein